MALPTPKGIEVYVVDDKGIRHPYHQLVNEEVDYVVMDEDMNYECCFRSLNNYYETMRPSEFKEFCRLQSYRGSFGAELTLKYLLGSEYCFR
ncbi:hypothetical protein [Fibrobacter succinogenes]|uniref:hypothetical protein n=1 Tax=Fibrobacter succinogenes TaxID=833 RepID=UPI001567F621|nr:hypothetical protein [Fibrobacter succinogenes]